ncbi:DUF2306 domain-containing protein [Yoonia sp. R2331]|uniref:DUF2306 domain-containing protein n=1 Tax=Yoonia sp. R2331 TaxID=3237238 RepID=UPI0034E5FC6A
MTKPSRLALRGPLGIALLGAVPALPGAFVLAGILQGPDTKGFLHDMVQLHYFASPEPIALHIASGILFCVLAPLQFSSRLRMRYRKLHRVAGRVAMIAGLLFALTAVLLMGRPPAAPELWLHYAAMNVGGLGAGLSLCLSFLAIRRGDIVYHRQWMRRAIAFGLLGASRILFDLILIPIFGYETPTSEGTSIWLAIALNLFVAERLSKSDRKSA